MALSDEEKRNVRKYLGVTEASVVGSLVAGLGFTTPVIEKLEAAFTATTATGETTIRELLAIMAPLWAALPNVAKRLPASKVGPIELRADEWEKRLEHFDFYRRALDRALFPAGAGIVADIDGGTSIGSIQGPWSEP